VAQCVFPLSLSTFFAFVQASDDAPMRCSSTDGLQVGGGINESNAQEWIDNGAEKVRFLPFPFLPSTAIPAPLPCLILPTD
jgi:hypothetical protein